jgi:nitroreductase
MSGPEDDEAGVEVVDQVLRTTRAVRRRLDLGRPVPDALLRECIDLAEQAPSGGGQSSRRWLVVRDPEVKAQVAELYRRAGGGGLSASAARARADGREPAPMLASGAFLADNLERVPALVLATIWGVHDGSGNPGLFDSVIQAAWSFCLALRARGLGTTWTTLHLRERDAMAALLGIPDGVTQVVLLPVAYTVGTDFKPVARRPAAEITYLDRWGFTHEHPAEGDGGWARLTDGPGVVVEVDIDARPEAVWPFVTDIGLPARLGTELAGARWLDGTGPAAGGRFEGHNRIEGVAEWTTVNHVVDHDPPRRFAWHVSDVERPGARWAFELEPLGFGGRQTRLRQHVVLGPGESGTSAMIAARPDLEARSLRRRREQLIANMQRTVDGIKALAEGAGDAVAPVSPTGAPRMDP